MNRTVKGQTDAPAKHDPLVELIRATEEPLFGIRMRFVVLKAFEDELTRATRGKPFHARGDIVWLALLDSRDMLFIHFASWAKACCKSGSFFGKLQAEHLSRLLVPAPSPP